MAMSLPSCFMLQRNGKPDESLMPFERNEEGKVYKVDHDRIEPVHFLQLILDGEYEPLPPPETKSVVAQSLHLTWCILQAMSKSLFK